MTIALLTLVDIQMPEVDGWAAARGLRARNGSRAYLVALTAQSSADDAELLTAAGFDGYANEPLRLAGLQSLLVEAYERCTRSETCPPLDPARLAEMRELTTRSGSSLLSLMAGRVQEALPDVLGRIERAKQEQDEASLDKALHEACGLFGLIWADHARALAEGYQGNLSACLANPAGLDRILQQGR